MLEKLISILMKKICYVQLGMKNFLTLDSIVL
jgi:hypothetical protein